MIDLRTFVQEYKTEIDAYIEAANKKPININDDMRCAWVKHDDWLYSLAESSGCDLRK